MSKTSNSEPSDSKRRYSLDLEPHRADALDAHAERLGATKQSILKRALDSWLALAEDVVPWGGGHGARVIVRMSDGTEKHMVGIELTMRI